MPVRLGTSLLSDIRYGELQVSKRYVGDTLVWERYLATIPSIPLSLLAESADESVDLSWSAPASDGGSPVIDYNIQYAIASGAYIQDFASSLVDFSKLNFRTENASPGNADTGGHGPDVPDNIRLNAGVLEVECGMQNYGDSLVRLNRPWLGTVFEFDMYNDNFNGSTGAYTHITAQDVPMAVTGFDEENAYLQNPQYGWDIAIGCPWGRTFDDYVKTLYWETGAPGPCSGIVQTGVMQHYKITRTTTQVTIEIDDEVALVMDHDDPTLRPLWVSYGTHNHASIKYTTDPFPGPVVETVTSFWDNVEFDVVGAPWVCAEVPPNTGSTFFGYALTNTEGSAQILTTSSLDIEGLLSAKLILNTGFYGDDIVDSTSRIHCRLNGGTDISTPFVLVSAVAANFSHSIDLDLDDLIDGPNELKIWVTDVDTMTQANMANISILAETSGVWEDFVDGMSTDVFDTVTGLVNGITYNFRVQALNAVGAGDWSDVASAMPAVPPTVPDAPITLVGDPEDTSVNLSWTAPYNGGSAITDYIIEYRTTVGPGSWNVFSDGTSIATTSSVTGLTNDTSYDFRVAAVNSVGTGAYSNVVTETPDEEAAGVAWLYDWADYSNGSADSISDLTRFNGDPGAIVDGTFRCSVGHWFSAYDTRSIAPPTTSGVIVMSVELEWLVAEGTDDRQDMVFILFADNTDGGSGSRNAVVIRQNGEIILENEFGGGNSSVSHTATTPGVYRFDIVADSVEDTYTFYQDGIEIGSQEYSSWRHGTSNHQFGWSIGSNDVVYMNKIHCGAFADGFPG